MTDILCECFTSFTEHLDSSTGYGSTKGELRFCLAFVLDIPNKSRENKIGMENPSLWPLVWLTFTLLIITVISALIVKSNNPTLPKSLLIGVLMFIGFIVISVICLVPVRKEAQEQSKNFYEGRPISICNLTNDINYTVWRPMYPTRIGNDIVFYAGSSVGSSGKLYSLYRIQFEPGLTEESFLHTTNGSYLVYNKGTNLLIGSYGGDVKILATNSTK